MKRGMMEVYQEYKYAAAMSFVSIAPKRKRRGENNGSTTK